MSATAPRSTPPDFEGTVSRRSRTAHGVLIGTGASGLLLGGTEITVKGTGNGIENAAELGNVELQDTVINLEGAGAGIRTGTSFTSASSAEINVLGNGGTGFRVRARRRPVDRQEPRAVRPVRDQSSKRPRRTASASTSTPHRQRGHRHADRRSRHRQHRHPHHQRRHRRHCERHHRQHHQRIRRHRHLCRERRSRDRAG